MKIFVIGDSISVHYGAYLEPYLKGCLDYSRKEGVGLALKDLNVHQGTNCSDERYVDHVHFTEEIRQRQAAYIAGWLCAFTPNAS